MCRSLPFEVIDDVRFASLEKIKIKNKHQIKISLDAKDYVLVELSKSSFFATRDVLKGSLERLVKNDEVLHEFNTINKKRIAELGSKGELASLYEKLVIKDKYLTAEDFFNFKEGSKLRKAEAIKGQKFGIDERFFNLNTIDVDSGQEIIHMSKKDKLQLLESFPELNEMYCHNFLEKFEDRQVEEAEFWDQFWKRQKDHHTLLYGGTTKGGKEYRFNMPTISDKADDITKKDAADLIDELENMDLLEGERYTDTQLHTAIEDITSSNSILNLLNNHSRVIQSKESRLLHKIKTDQMIEEKSYNKKNSKLENSHSHISSHRQYTDLSKPIISEEEQVSKKKLDGLREYWKDFLAERERRAKGLSLKPQFFLETEDLENKEVFKMLNYQIQRFENKEVTGKEYPHEFREKLLFFQKKLYFLNRIFYKLMPVNNQSLQHKKKVKNMVESLKSLKQEIDQFYKINSQTLEESKKSILRNPIERLLIMLDCSKNKAYIQ